MLNVSDQISKRLKMELYWLPWLININKKKFANKNSKYDYIKDICDSDYSNLINSLMNAKMIVTDTYHLALVAWRLRIPAACIGTGTQYPYSTVDDKKKEVFYSMHNILHLYLFSENLNDENKINEYIDFIINNFEKDYYKIIFNKIEKQSEDIQIQLLKYLEEKILY